MEPVNHTYKGLLYTISNSNSEHKGYLFGMSNYVEEEKFEYEAEVNQSFNQSKSLVVSVDYHKHEIEINRAKLTHSTLKNLVSLVVKVLHNRMQLHTGSEKQFIQQAITNKTSIYELEDFNTIFPVSEKFEQYLIKIDENIEEFEKAEREMKVLINAVKNGVKLDIESIGLEKSVIEEHYTHNQKIACNIDHLLKQDVYPFIVLNYIDLLGEKSLVTYLRSKNWTVTRLNA